MSTVTTRARNLIQRISKHMPRPCSVVMSRADAKALYAEAGIDITDEQLDEMAIHTEDEDEIPSAP